MSVSNVSLFWCWVLMAIVPKKATSLKSVVPNDCAYWKTAHFSVPSTLKKCLLKSL